MEYQETANTTPVKVIPMATVEHSQNVEVARPQIEVHTPEVSTPVAEREPLEAKIINAVQHGESYDQVVERVANNDFSDSENENQEVETSEASQLESEKVLFDTASPNKDENMIETEQSRIELHPAIKEDPLFQQKLGEVIQEQQVEGKIDYEEAEREAYRRYTEAREDQPEEELDEMEILRQEDAELYQMVSSLQQEVDVMTLSFQELVAWLEKLRRAIEEEEKKRQEGKTSFVDLLGFILDSLIKKFIELTGEDNPIPQVAVAA